MVNQTLDLPAPVEYVRSARAQRLRITLKPDPQIRVTLPRRSSLEEARRFVAAKEAWIRKHLRQMAQQQQHAAASDAPPIDLQQAQDELFARLERFSQQHNLPYRRATFRCQKTKWGSCSGQNNISLNINIAFLPRHLQDYLLLHELAHIRHKNHSSRFWDTLDGLCGGDAKALSKELNQYRFRIQSP